jgi:cell division protein FtsW
LAAVWVPGIGVARNGALRWLPFGQPSEFAKLALIIFLADYAVAHQARMRERNTGFLYPGLVAGVIVSMVFFEPDWGTATLIAAETLVLLAIAGVPGAYLASAVVVGCETLALLLLRNPLRLERILAFLDPEQYRNGVGWQVWQALLSLGSGGLFGTFFGEGDHKNGFVPEQQTDFVLSPIGEELGLLGTSLVLLMFVIILLAGTRIAWRIEDPFGQLLAAGITQLIGLQAFINIGVVTSILPNKGIALPFVSYGGSSMVCMLTGVGLLISIARHGPVAGGSLEDRLAPGTRPKVGGPVGSLLDDPLQRNSRALAKRMFRWIKARLNSRFPSVPLHRYQRPPRLNLRKPQPT